MTYLIILAAALCVLAIYLIEELNHLRSDLAIMRANLHAVTEREARLAESLDALYNTVDNLAMDVEYFITDAAPSKIYEEGAL